jgi:iron(III) transport system permease protein
MVFMKNISPELEEAGRLVANRRGVIRGITLPLIMPGIALSATLVFLLTFGEFGVPSYLRYDVFPVESFVQFSAFYNFPAATAAAVPLAAITLILLWAESAYMRKQSYRLRPSSRINRLPPMELGRSRKWLSALVALLGIMIVILPVVVLVIQSAGIDAYAEALKRAGDSLFRSLIYAVTGATLLTIMGFFTGYLIQTKSLPVWRSVDLLTVFLFALPSTVIGIGLVSLWNTPRTNFIYGTPLIIILGYLAKYTALTSRISIAQLAQIPASMQEAAQMSGAGWFRRMAFIVVPLSRRGLLAGWLAGYIFSLRDSGITMLVYPAGHETLPLRILTFMANGSPELIAALCIVMITATLLPVAIIWFIPNLLRGKEPA